MDLDGEGRRDLDEMDFWRLGRREEDGEQDLKWRKKKRRKKMHTEIESLKLGLL